MKPWQKYVLIFLMTGVISLLLFSGYLVGLHNYPPYGFFRRVELNLFGNFFDRSSGEDNTPEYYDSIFLRLYSDQVNIRDRLTRNGRGGGMTSFGDNLLLLTYEGTVLDVHSAGDIRDTNIEVPDYGYSKYLEAAELEQFKNLNHDFTLFRYNDIIFYESGTHHGLAISYTEFNGVEHCYTNTVALLPIEDGIQSVDELSAGPNDWDIIYRTKPCLPLKDQATALDGGRAGGRLAFQAPSSLFLGSGDYQWDDMNSSNAIPQKPSYEYGKVMKIDLASRESQIYATGIRNPQGIVFDKNGSLWTVEHGVRGGDELNRIIEDNNYGWPVETLGTQYSKLPVPQSTEEKYGRHDSDRFTEPVFAWLPSVAISNLTLVDGFHSSWNGDLLMASLKSMSLYHIRIKDNRVMFSEQVEIGERIRYVHQHTDGRIILWTDSKNLIFLTGQPYSDNFVEDYLVEAIPDEGFRQRVHTAITACRQCHSIEPGDHDMAPSLAMVFDANISSTDFANYSPALKQKNGVWTRENLGKFLQNPESFAPGTTMPNPGLNDEAVREEIIDFLRAVSTGPIE
ncbi:MAG: PQQ-dependent sugar dehydrogenase [Balneolaceae bacterium]|nr:PQQ-dependent sugar dehydrogenase [Balneolaceae bacterium]